MNRKIQRALEPGFRLFFIALLLFALITLYFNRIAGILELVSAGVILTVYKRMSVMRRRDVLKYVEQLSTNVASAGQDSLVNCPLPLVIIRVDTREIIWNNQDFVVIAKQKERTFSTHIEDIVPNFDLHWLLEGKPESPSDVTMHGRRYRVLGNIIRTGSRNTTGLLATLYWINITELVTLRQERLLSRPVFSIIIIDNYEECTKNIQDSQKSGMLAAVDERITQWVVPTKGILRKYDRDRYIFIFEERYLSFLVEEKFALLDSAREVLGVDNLPVTLSIGIGKEGQNFLEGFNFAQLAIDMALSRGGDQAVIKNRFNFEFYGGRAKETAKRTKVKSRVMASTLTRLIQDSSFVLAMGHRNSDLDATGAAVGIACIARKLGRPFHFIYNTETSASSSLVERMRSMSEYDDVFIDSQTALLKADRNTLLVVLDCNRPELVESRELLQSMHKIAVIDHHRRASAYIDNTVLNLHEPYASSTCELVCEMLQYICDPKDISRTEAEALLSGIVLDTKNFSMHTGVRTFEAATYLRSAGADTVSIKRLFQIDFSSIVERYDIIRAAQMHNGNIMISVMDKPVHRTIAAQAADALLDIVGIGAAFVVFPQDGETVISARSLSDINVQMICEKMGGGGHQTIAGVQLKGISTQEAKLRLESAIELYFKENRVG